MELTDRTYDLIVVDAPPPRQSAGTAVLYSRASSTRLRQRAVKRWRTDDGKWMPFGQTVDEFRAHVRTFTGPTSFPR